MKFGRSLPRNQVPEWASQYINYKGLKKLIKNAAAATPDDEEPDLAGFFHTLDRNLEDVDHFYNKKYQDLSRRLKLLEERYGSTKESATSMDQEDREDLLAALLEHRGLLRKLQWYGEVNRRGFIKITKKLDKKIPTAQAQKKYLPLKVDPAAFATNASLFNALNQVNDWISLLSDAASVAAAAKTNNDQKLAVAPAMKRTTSKQAYGIPDEEFVRMEQQIKKDDAQALGQTLKEAISASPAMPEHAYQQVLKKLLQRAIYARSGKCVSHLLRQIVFLDDADDINRRNCIHRYVIYMGRTQSTADRESKADVVPDAETELYSFIAPAAAPTNPFKPLVAQDDQQRSRLTRQDKPTAFLQFLLDNLQATQRSALLSRDANGRTPLHFAAEFGIRVVCEIIIEHLQKWKMFKVDQGIDGPEWQDNDGWAPLHLSVIGGHPLTTQALLDAERTAKIDAADTAIRRSSPKSSAVLALATKANFIEVVRILVKAGVNLNYQDEQGETALHVAARFNHAECANLLLTGSDTQKADTELTEATYSWTPLFVACVDGNLKIVELLIEAGADAEHVDSSGWTAKEHAALRGHMKIAEYLAQVTPDPDSEDGSSSTASTSPPTASSLTERKSNGASTPSASQKISEPVKSFGHRYLTDKSMILVSLGSMDMRKPKKVVQLDRIPLNSAHSTQLDTALSIVVSAKYADGEPEVIDLPVHDNVSTEPIVFHAADPLQVKLLFDLVPTYAGNHERIVGRGVALLSAVMTNLGAKKASLQGDVTVPIIAAGDLEVIGSVTFNFLIITPFKHPNMSVSENQTYWKSMASTMVIGHRGLGKNVASHKSLQLGENTLQSFISAASLGASYVEFDVQLTRDHIPVIYHDFCVSETGIDAPVHTLTLEQFLHVNDSRTPKPSRPSSPSRYDLSGSNGTRIAIPDTNGRQPRHRSMSLSTSHDEGADMDERMKHTRDFKKKGFKGNSRGSHIQSPFVTLEDLFHQLPQSVGFNIEMKYPMLSETEDEDMDHYAIEANSFVDTVLTKVYDLGRCRNMIFSSFNPDICLLLNFKQPSVPVLFLTDAGTTPVGDIRASSLQEAIRFTSRWNLLGVVSEASPFVVAPRLVRVVKESGLVCVSYGSVNNQNEKVKRQVDQGIDAVIVDNVLAIRKGLTDQPAPGKTSTVPSSTIKSTSLTVPLSDLHPSNKASTAADGLATKTTPSRVPRAQSPARLPQPDATTAVNSDQPVPIVISNPITAAVRTSMI